MRDVPGRRRRDTRGMHTGPMHTGPMHTGPVDGSSTDMVARTGWAARPLGTRLMLAQGAVVTAGIVTASAVAAFIGPPLFHEHLVRAGMAATASEVEHVEQAYQEASLVSLGVALAIAVLCALAVTWYVAGRLRRPLGALTRAAEAMGRGDYAVRASAVGAGPELSSLADAFNAMAGRLADTESTRRRLIGDVAHEMRTPVATMAAYLDGLDDGVASWDASTSTLLRSNVERLARLCEDMSAVSGAEEGHLHLRPTGVSVSEILAVADREARPLFEAKGVSLHLEPGPQSLLLVDPERMAQVLSNLLNNALRHTPAGGSVTVAASRDGGLAHIDVVDSGEGLDAEQVSRVFERFYRGDTARTRDARGSGVGLTIAKAIVEAHGGHLSASSPGRGLGATFTVTLPAVT